MNDDDPEGVTRLPVKFKKAAPEERTVVRAWEVGKPPECSHLNAHYIVSEANAEVECGRCGGKLNPVWVLCQLATHDRRYEEAQTRYKEEQARLAARSRTKCDNCGQMTRISRR